MSLSFLAHGLNSIFFSNRSIILARLPPLIKRSAKVNECELGRNGLPFSATTASLGSLATALSFLAFPLFLVVVFLVLLALAFWLGVTGSPLSALVWPR